MSSTTPPQPQNATAALVLADGSVFWGYGLGAAGFAIGEVCFNTSMTGYQEILSDPSYAGQIIPVEGTAFLSVKDSDKPAMVLLAQQLVKMGFKLLATEGTAKSLNIAGMNPESINKVMHGQPHVVDAMTDGRVDIVFNTAGGVAEISDSRSLREAALLNQIPYYTTVAGARAAVAAISALRTGTLEVAPLQSYLGSSF